MNSIETLTTFFGWSTVVNVGLLALSAVFVILLRGWASRIHGRMFGLGGEELSCEYFRFLAQYKMAIFVFSLVPYIALKIMA